MPVLAFEAPGPHLVRTRRARAGIRTNTAPGADHLLTCSWGDGTIAAEVGLDPAASRHQLEHDYARDGVYRVSVSVVDGRRHRLAHLDRYLAVASAPSSDIAMALGVAIERFDGLHAPDTDGAQVGIRMPLDNGPMSDGELAVLIGATEMRSASIAWRYRTASNVHFGGLGLVEAVWPCRFRGRLSFPPRAQVTLNLYLGSQDNGPRGPDIVLRSTRDPEP
jgi:hypothetical protein